MTSFSLRHPLLRRSLLALAGTALLAGLAAAPARADDDDWRWRHERREHEEHEQAWHAHKWAKWCAYHPGAYAYPGYICPIPAPPAVVYAPAPPPPPAVIYQPPPSVEFVVPIHIR